MADLIGILIDNLKETFKAVERLLLLGFTAGVVLLVLAITDPELVGFGKLMFAEIEAPAVFGALVALGTYAASGAFAAFYFAARRRIVKRLRAHAGLVEALLTYPSVVARIGAAQIVALACVGGTGMIALLLFYVPTHGMAKALLTSVVFGSPYVVILGMALLTAFQERSITSSRE